MSPTEPHGGQHDEGDYEVRLDGHLEPRWAAWFDGLTLAQEADGTTVVRGPGLDQAALHGLLQKVRDIGLPLLSVSRTSPIRTPHRCTLDRSTP